MTFDGYLLRRKTSRTQQVFSARQQLLTVSLKPGPARRQTLLTQTPLNKLFRMRLATSLAAFIVVVAGTTIATPPPNDTCEGIEVIPTNGPFPYLTAIIDLKDATTTGDPTSPSCVFGGVNRGIWYRFTPPATALYTISCSGDTASTVQDTVMAIYTASGGCAGPFLETACSDDEGDLQSAISRTLAAGVPYYILVWVSGVSAPLGNNSTVQLRVTQPTIPANDACAGAETIPTSGPFPYLTAVSDATLATETGDPISTTCNNQSVRSVWYRFTPALTALYEFSLCTNTATTVYDPLIGIYTGGCGGTFTRVACNDNSPACGGSDADLNFRSVLTLNLTNGVDYYVVVWEAGNFDYIPGETSLQLRVARSLPPVVATLQAYGLTSTGAVLTASITPNAATTYGWFQYGPTTNYGSATAPANLGASTSAMNLQTTIGGLTPGALHHFRVAASNVLGTSFGTNRTFAWSSAAPNFTEIYGTNGGFTLRFTGQAAQLYAVEASTNLMNWTSLGLSAELGGGLFQLIAPAAVPEQFFRVRAP